MHLIFIPLISWKTIHILDKTNSNLIDGFVVIPYDILFLKQKIDIATTQTADKKRILADLLQETTPYPAEVDMGKNAFIKN